MSIFTRFKRKKEDITSLQTYAPSPERDWVRMVVVFSILLCMVLAVGYWVQTHIAVVQFQVNDEKTEVYRRGLVESQLEYFEEYKKSWQKLQVTTKELLQDTPTTTSATTTGDSATTTQTNEAESADDKVETNETASPSSEVNVVPSF